MKSIINTTFFLISTSLFFGCKNNPSVPGRVNSFNAISEDKQISLVWNPPSSDGGSEITSYEITRDNWMNKDTKTAVQLSHTYTYLINGNDYTFKVRAVNEQGAGAESILTAKPAVNSPGKNDFHDLDYRIGLWVNLNREDTLIFLNSTELIRKGKVYTYEEFLYEIQDNNLIIKIPDNENSKTYHSILKVKEDTVILGNMYTTIEFENNSGIFTKH